MLTAINSPTAISEEPSWTADYESRMNPEVLTMLLRESVPALGWVDWSFTEIAEGRALSILPLNPNSTNQHGTHQAALIALAADYTGGAAVSSIVRGISLVGVHPQHDKEGAAVWLASLEIKYIQPSASDLVLSAEIPEEKWERIRQRYKSGQMVLEKVDIEFNSDAGRVATGTCTYFLKQAKKLRPTAVTSTPSAIFAHQTKASARLIAGVRHLETIREDGLIRDDFAGKFCGQHGHLLARRFTQLLPSLQPMIAARTKSIDDLIEEQASSGRCRQLVLIGAGFDSRPYRLSALRTGESRIFSLDLPHMLVEKDKLLEQAGILPCDAAEVGVPIDLERQSISGSLLKTEYGFDPQLPTVFVMEGVSMYQSLETFTNMLDSVQSLMQHPGSVLWIDVVKTATMGSSAPEDLQRFLDGMRRLGEPFILGFDDLSGVASEHGLRVVHATPSSWYLHDYFDPVLSYYTFYLLSGSVNAGYS